MPRNFLWRIRSSAARETLGLPIGDVRPAGSNIYGSPGAHDREGGALSRVSHGTLRGGGWTSHAIVRYQKCIGPPEAQVSTSIYVGSRSEGWHMWLVDVPTIMFNCRTCENLCLFVNLVCEQWRSK